MGEVTNHKDLFLTSLNRCSESEDFIPSFYENFFETSQAVRNKFLRTDFEKQNEMLIGSLKLAAEATIGTPEALRELKERAESHDRYHLNIKPELYDLWLDSIITTARSFDPQWNETIEDSWNFILKNVIQFMAKRY